MFNLVRARIKWNVLSKIMKPKMTKHRNIYLRLLCLLTKWHHIRFRWVPPIRSPQTKDHNRLALLSPHAETEGQGTDNIYQFTTYIYSFSLHSAKQYTIVMLANTDALFYAFVILCWAAGSSLSKAVNQNDGSSVVLAISEQVSVPSDPNAFLQALKVSVVTF